MYFTTILKYDILFIVKVIHLIQEGRMVNMANLYLLFDGDENLDMRDESHSINAYHIECDAADEDGDLYEVVMDLTRLITSVTSYATRRQISIKLVPDIITDKYICLTDEEYQYLNNLKSGCYNNKEDSYKHIKPCLKELMLKTCNKYQYAYWIDHEAEFIDYFIGGLDDADLAIYDYGRRTGIRMIYDKYCRCIEQVRKGLELSHSDMRKAMASYSDAFQYLAD